MPTPLVWVAVTLVVFECASIIYRRGRLNPLLNPMILSMFALIGILHVGHVSYAQYMTGGQYFSFLLGPATVALAVPLYRNLALIRSSAAPISIALVAGSATAIVSAVVIGSWLGLPEVIVRSLAAKSVTTPVAMTISGQIGGIPALTAAFVCLNGVIGVMVDRAIFSRNRHWCSRGLALGVTAHGIGTSGALVLDEQAGAFSGLGMGLNAILSAACMPVVFAAFAH